MDITKNILTELYINKKYSSAQIASVLKCSEHKINYWIKKFQIPKRSIAEAMYNKFNPKGDPFKYRQPQTLEESKLFGLGLGLYWGEGNKKNINTVRLGNTNPRLIKKFVEFLIRVFEVDKNKLRFGLQIFSDLSKEECLKFWLGELKELKIIRNQFYKVIITPARSVGNYREKSQYGVLTVYFSNVRLKKLLDSMLPT